MVVIHLDVTQSSYVRNIYSIGSCFWSFFVGFAIAKSGKFKWVALYVGIPFHILGVACMIAFRAPGSPLGYIVMCQIFIAFAGGTLVICEQVAAMAATTHQYVAVVLAVEGMFSSIGGAIGSTISSVIWQSIFPKKLMEYLPQESMANYTMIYADVNTQLKYEVGSPTRGAIERAYGDAQMWMCISSAIVSIGAIVAVLVWRDISVKNFKQVKGRVI